MTVPLSPRLWPRLLTGGALVWLLSAAITEVTGDTILVPTVIVVGSFLIPVTLVAFALSRRTAGHLTADAIVLGFFAAGTLGLVSSALLETYVTPAATATFIVVALIEESAKGALMWRFARPLRRVDPRDGLVLGAVVGAGFSAFESAGYALRSLLDHAGTTAGLIDVLETEAQRGLLAPFGHITWTALLGGALFVGSRRRIALTFVGVVALHALWDEAYGWAIMVANGATGAGWHLMWPNAQAWARTPTSAARIWFDVAYDGLLALLAIVGTAWIARAWRLSGCLRTDHDDLLFSHDPTPFTGRDEGRRRMAAGRA